MIFYICVWACTCWLDPVEGNPKLPTPIVIAHRGASGYAVEHTEASKVLAHAQGADYIEQDVVLSKDREFIVTHDITMEETTNVEQIFQSRSRADGRWYFADFTWSELQQLEMHERTRKDGKQPVFSERFPGACGQRILRLRDEILLLRGLDQTTGRTTAGRTTGLYIELKSPAFHAKEFGCSMGGMLLALLKEHDVTDASSRCYIQCFEGEELAYLRKELNCAIPLIHLLGRRLEASELKPISDYAAGIGPSLDLLAVRADDGTIRSTGIVEAAHTLGLQVHPYTTRRELQPQWSSSVDETHRFLIDNLHVDGFFTDFPDLGRQAVDR